MSDESGTELRRAFEICDESERRSRRQNDELNALFDSAEKDLRDKNIPYTPFVRFKSESSLPSRLLYLALRPLIQAAVFLACWVAGIAILFWLIQLL